MWLCVVCFEGWLCLICLKFAIQPAQCMHPGFCKEYIIGDSELSRFVFGYTANYFSKIISEVVANSVVRNKNTLGKKLGYGFVLVIHF